MESVNQLQMLHEAIKLWVIMDNIEKHLDIPELSSDERDQLMQFRQLIYPQRCHNVSLSDQLHSAAAHMQRYLNCEATSVVSRCSYADLRALVARVDKLDSLHLQQLDDSDLEEGEISTSVKQEPRTVKLEPRMLGDEDLQDCKLGRRAGKRCYCASDPASANSPHSRNYKRSRPSKDHTTSGPPGRPRASPVWSYFIYVCEDNESICKIDTQIGLCGAVLKGKNSTNLRKHIESFHPEVYGLVAPSPTAGGCCVYKRRYSENMGRRRASPVWEYFEYLADPDMSICKVAMVDGQHCAMMLKGKNPTNLKHHLQSHHEQIYEQYWDVNGSLLTHDSAVADRCSNVQLQLA